MMHHFLNFLTLVFTFLIGYEIMKMKYKSWILTVKGQILLESIIVLEKNKDDIIKLLKNNDSGSKVYNYLGRNYQMIWAGNCLNFETFTMCIKNNDPIHLMNLIKKEEENWRASIQESKSAIWGYHKLIMISKEIQYRMNKFEN